MSFQIVSPDPKKAQDKQQKLSLCLLINEQIWAANILEAL